MTEVQGVTSADVLTDAFGRVREAVHRVVEGLTADQLAVRLDPGANSICWLIWHLTRVQDDHLADAFGADQLWPGFEQRFGLPLASLDTGYGHSSEQVAQVRVSSPGLLTEYYDAVHTETIKFVSGLSDADLDRIVDYAWDPPVSLGVRLVSVISDDLQHAGQAAYLRGLIERGLGG